MERGNLLLHRLKILISVLALDLSSLQATFEPKQRLGLILTLVNDPQLSSLHPQLLSALGEEIGGQASIPSTHEIGEITSLVEDHIPDLHDQARLVTVLPASPGCSLLGTALCFQGLTVLAHRHAPASMIEPVSESFDGVAHALSVLTPVRQIGAAEVSSEMYFAMYLALLFTSSLLRLGASKSTEGSMSALAAVLELWTSRLAGDVESRLDRTKVKDMLLMVRGLVMALSSRGLAEMDCQDRPQPTLDHFFPKRLTEVPPLSRPFIEPSSEASTTRVDGTAERSGEQITDLAEASTTQADPPLPLAPRTSTEFPGAVDGSQLAQDASGTNNHPNVDSTAPSASPEAVPDAAVPDAAVPSADVSNHIQEPTPIKREPASMDGVNQSDQEAKVLLDSQRSHADSSQSSVSHQPRVSFRLVNPPERFSSTAASRRGRGQGRAKTQPQITAFFKK
eukprot:m.841141 g.841141  ORF g.841141 m.841141 type:complete len:452 (+) comp59516_c0_seq3:1154-2509(+)